MTRSGEKATELLQDLIILCLGNQVINNQATRKLASYELKRVIDVLRLVRIVRIIDKNLR